MPALTPPHSGNATLAVIGLTVLSACAYLAGYTHGQSRVKVEQAKVETRTETITQVVTVTDKAAVNTLQAKLKAYQAATSTLQAQIEEAAHAHQTTPGADPGACALPVSLRDNLNRTLATGP